ncbi:MAG TPA: DUF1003 domain-containing protein [Longimicrobiaceae bacterium]|jgi:uncharacterized membrane protein|nr:DUF1003 domain-containing protein [Longimicrobiaceae bacterium]
MSSPYPWKALFGDEKRTHNVNELFDSERTVGERASDAVAATMGSWRFIIIQSVILACWIVLNAVAWVRHWDPYPFILMNLVLSMQAAYAAPIIMMSQNRQAARDRLEAHNDFLTDCKAEEEVRSIMGHLEAQDHMLREILVRLEAMNVTELEMPRRLADAESAETVRGSVDVKPSASGGPTP